MTSSKTGKAKPQTRAQARIELTRAVRALRQAAIIATSAAKELERVAQLQNPDRFLRHWTAEQIHELTKTTKKGSAK